MNKSKTERRRVLVDVRDEVREVLERAGRGDPSPQNALIFKLARAAVSIVDEVGAFDVAALAQAADTWLAEASKRAQKDRGLLISYKAAHDIVNANNDRQVALGRLRMFVRDVLRVAEHEAKGEEVDQAAEQEEREITYVPYLVAPDGASLRLTEKMRHALTVTERWHVELRKEEVPE